MTSRIEPIQTPISRFETAAASKWLAQALARARAEARTAPSAEAVARMRLRVFGERRARRRVRTLAA